MKRDDDRKLGERLFLEHKGRITNKELAERIGAHPATVARWKKLDEWDLKLVRALNQPEEPDIEDELYSRDSRQITLLNERIEKYLERQELAPSEIRDLAEAKFHLMQCSEIINDQMRYSLLDHYHGEEQDLDW